MKPCFSLALALIPLCILSCQHRQPAGTSAKPGPGAFFVATNGNDAWSGALPFPNQSRTDGPFATVERSLQAARAFRGSTAAVPGEKPRIVLRQGTYFLTRPLVLKPEDSGLEITAYRQEEPVLSGGRLLSGWREVKEGGKTVWVADVPMARDLRWAFRELWVDGKRAVRARHPNHGYLPVAELIDKSENWTQGHSRFRYREGDMRAVPGLTNAEVMVMTRWVESRLPIQGIDESQRLLTFTKRSVFELSSGDVYYVEGAREFLDAPGEWFWDSAAGKVYYMPLPGQKLSSVEAIAPVLTQLLRFEGTPESGSVVRGIAMRGLTFSHTEWCFPEGFQKDGTEVEPAPDARVGGFAQAAIGVPGAVWGRGLHEGMFENCRFVNLGNYGLELTRGCVGNRIQRCEFAFLGAGGMKIGETRVRDQASDITRDNVVSDCHIHDGGRMFHSAIGIWIGQSPGNKILHNDIHDFYYTGISIGWTWGYDPRALATNSLVAFNHVHHIGVQSDGDGPILSDMSGIYTLGRHIGSVIHNNLWHDVAGIHYGGWGIYFDEGTTGILAASNVVYRTTHGGFHQHYGATNKVQNNIFLFARDYQVQRSRPEEHISFRFQTNIVFFDKGVLYGGTWSGDKFVTDYNLLFDLRCGASASTNLGPTTWDRWLERGHDRHSVWADPLFVNPPVRGREREASPPQYQDFRLKPESPAYKLGFQPIDLRSIGPRR